MTGTAVEFVGMFYGLAALFAGMSIWVVLGTVYYEWSNWKHPPVIPSEQLDWQDRLIFIVISLAVCAVAHGIAWIARGGMTRREKSIGMSKSFWKVLYYLFYGIGFVGGGILFSKM